MGERSDGADRSGRMLGSQAPPICWAEFLYPQSTAEVHRLTSEVHRLTSEVNHLTSEVPRRNLGSTSFDFGGQSLDFGSTSEGPREYIV
jgi:hypothetical protein